MLNQKQILIILGVVNFVLDESIYQIFILRRRIELKKSLIAILQIICLIMIVSNHFLPYHFYAKFLLGIDVHWFGMKVSNLIVDIVLYLTIGFQLLIIVLIIDYKRD